MQSTFRPIQSPPGFTIVELLVSIAVLTIIVAFVAQLMNSATLTSTGSRKHMDADASARLIFDRMADDFAGMVKRPDVNYIFYKNGNGRTTGSNDAMFFYSEAPAYSSGTTNLSSAALLGYRINTGNTYYPGVPVLERLGQNLTWDQPNPGATPSDTAPGGMVFMTYPAGSSTPATGSTLVTNWTTLIGSPPFTQQDPAYHVLSDQVFRMEICFLLNAGSFTVSAGTFKTTKAGFSNSPTAIYNNSLAIVSGSASQPFVTSNYYSGSNGADTPGNVYGMPPDLAGVVVTLALLDDSSRKTGAGQLTAIGARLQDSLSGNTTPATTVPSATAQLPAQQWLSKITAAGFAATAGVSQSTVSQIRIYQRLFYLNPN